MNIQQLQSILMNPHPRNVAVPNDWDRSGLPGWAYHSPALLDLENPTREIARLPYPLFSPEFDYELKGEVNNVCFPTGTTLFGDTLYIYYGAADDKIACASVSLTALLHELMLNTTKHE